MTLTAQRVCVSGLIRRGDTLLLLKRASHETFLPNYYDLPGGKVDLGESPAVAIVREVFEEAGVVAKVVGLYNAWDWTSEYRGVPTQFISLSYHLEIPDAAEPKISTDFSGHAWVSEAELNEI